MQRSLRWRSSEVLGKAVALIAIGGAAVMLLVYGWLALRWQRQPFVGAIFSYTLTAEQVYSMTGEPWAAQAAGVQPGDRLLGLNGQAFSPDPHQAQAEFQAALQGLAPNVPLTVTLARPAGVASSGDAITCTASVDGAALQTCEVNLCGQPDAGHRFPELSSG